MVFTFKRYSNSCYLDDIMLPKAKLISVGRISESKPTRITVSFEVDDIAIAHSSNCDKAVETCAT